MGSKWQYKENVGLEGLKVELTHVRRTVRNMQGGENFYLYWTYFSICYLKMHLGIQI